MDNIENNWVLNELKILEELQASEELYTPFYWIEESNGYGKLTTLAEKVALKHLKPKEEDEVLFNQERVQEFFMGWGMMIY